MLTPERAESPALPAGIVTAVEIAGAIEGLPAVPTTDWCDRAGACLTRLARSAIALVMIATIDETGRILAPEAIGVAAGNWGPERAKGIPRAQPRVGQDLAIDHTILDGIRTRAERLSTIGWSPDGGSPTSAGLLNSMATGRNWRVGALGRVWGEPAPADLLVGLTPMGELEPGRVMLVQVAPTGPATLDAETPGVLRALLPVLARRAVLAIGPLRSHPGQWLTTREQAVLDQLILGKSVKQIAEEVGRSPHTVHDHVKSLHRKLNANSRGELIARAMGHGSRGGIGLGLFPRATAEPAEGAEPARGVASQIEPSPGGKTSPVGKTAPVGKSGAGVSRPLGQLA